MFLFSEKTGTPNTPPTKGRYFFYIFLAARINNFFEIFESIFCDTAREIFDSQIRQVCHFLWQNRRK